MPNDFGIKAITNIPGWQDNLQSGDKVKTEAQSYAMVPLVFRAIRLRASALASVPIHVFDGDNDIGWPFPTKARRLIWKTEAALMLRGASYWIKLSNNVITRNLVYLNPFSIEQKYLYNKDSGEDDYIFTQPITGQGPWNLDEMVYIREYDPIQDTAPGISSALVSMNDSQLLNYITRFAWHFFEGGAMPVTLLGFKNTSQPEAKRVEDRIRRAITRISKAFSVVGFKSDHVDINTLTPELRTLALEELYNQAKKNVGAAFGIPTTMLEDPAANRATAESHRLSFWAETIRPEGEMIQDEINEQVFDDMGLRFEFGFDEMDVFQEDEAKRADSLKAYVEAGFPLDMAATILGVDLNDEQLARLVQMDSDKQARAQAFAESNPFQGRAQDGGNGANAGKSDTMHAHLKLWQTKSLNRLKIKRSPAVEFTSDLIPDGLNGAILGALESARNPQDVHRIFDSIWGSYP